MSIGTLVTVKRFALVVSLLILLCAPVFAGTVPISGTIRSANGNLFNGRIRFTLNYSAARDSCSSNIVVAQTVEFRVVNGILPTSAQITPNDCLVPANTVYVTQYLSSAGAVIAQNVFYVQGASFNIGTAVPTPLTTSNISFATFTGLDLVESDVIEASTSLTAATMTDSELTATRCTFAGTAGRLSDDSDCTFATDTLTATKIIAPTSIKTPSLFNTAGALALTTVTSGNITLNPAAAATAAVTTNARFEQSVGTAIVTGSCSSGDCTIPGDGNFFLLSGTTAVDGFSTAGVQAGTIFIFTTNGNLTLNNAGTVAAGYAAMRLVGAANVSMTADDLIQFIYTGTTYDQLAPVLVK